MDGSERPPFRAFQGGNEDHTKVWVQYIHNTKDQPVLRNGDVDDMESDVLGRNATFAKNLGFGDELWLMHGKSFACWG